MCAFSRIPHSVHRPPVSRLTLMGRDCLLAWHPSLGTALPGQARRMLLASYVFGNRCDSWLSALWHGFALRQHMAGGPSHWRLCLPHAAWSLWPSPGQPCPSLAYHLSLFAAHAFTFATGSHASVAGWDRPTCVPCRQSFLVCLLWLCLALVRRLECLRCLKMQMVYSVCTSTSSRPESRLRLHKCNIWAALRASPLVLRRYHASPRSGPNTPALFAGRLDHLSAAAWVSPPCLMRVLRLPPVHKPDYQPGERTQGPREYKQPGTGTQAP